MKGASLEAFKRYWANPSYGLPGVPGVFGMVTLGDVDFFLLDNRFNRYPNRYPQTAGQGDVRPRQLEWLKQALVSSRAPFKIVVAGGQFWNRANRYEAFGNFPPSRGRSPNGSPSASIRACCSSPATATSPSSCGIERPGIYPLYEFTSSPLTAGPFANSAADERENPELVPGTLVTQRNFGMLRVSGPREDRALTLEAYAADGRLLWQRRIAAAELR